MEHQVIGSVMPVLELTLQAGERIFAQPGSMTWMDDNMVMETSMGGGLLGGLKRSLMGESMFFVWYHTPAQKATVAFGHSSPGYIMPVDVSKDAVICQKRAFLCAQEGVSLELAFQRRLGVGFFGGEGFVMQRLSGTGTAFLEIDGECVTKDLAVGEVLRVDTGSVAAYQDTVQMDIKTVKGFSNVLFGGEGLFLTSLRGPGRVWLQTMPLQNLARDLIPYLPKPSK